MTDRPRVNAPGALTIAVLVGGLGSAAIVTSLSALNVGSDAAMVRLSAIGGTSVLLAAAIVTLVCGFLLQIPADRNAWAAAGAALALTAAGSGLRALSILAGQTMAEPGAAESVYALGMLVLLGALIGWPLTRLRDLSLGTLLLETAGVSICAVGLFWFTVGSGAASAARRGGAIEPVRMQEFLGFEMTLGVACVFMLLAAVHLWRHEAVMPWVCLVAGVVCIVVGDVMWLVQMTGEGWTPGALGDFIHISGHVLIAAGAALSLENQRYARRRSPVAETPKSPGAPSPA